jgi:predicted GNAT family N-acyltransferase
VSRWFSCLIVVLGGPLVESRLQSCLAAGIKKATAAKSAEHILVLRNGRIISGRVRLVDEGYQVERSGGRVVVPREFVEIEAKNLVDAYRKMRAAMPQPTAARHVVLARWCLSYGLKSEAARELRDALRLAPMHRTAQSMVSRLDPIIRSRATTPTTQATVATLTRDAVAVEPLGGLPTAEAVEFVRRVQPLLVNRCGNGSCHGPSASRKFRLEPIGRNRSGFQVRTRRNLAAVLGQLDRTGAGRSRLLLYLRRGHGASGRRLRVDRMNAKQVDVVEKWIAAVVADRPGSSTRQPQPKAKVSRNERPGTPAGPFKTSARRVAVDVFDPEVFNRETRRRAALLKRKR